MTAGHEYVDMTDPEEVTDCGLAECLPSLIFIILIISFSIDFQQTVRPYEVEVAGQLVRCFSLLFNKFCVVADIGN